MKTRKRMYVRAFVYIINPTEMNKKEFADDVEVELIEDVVISDDVI